MSLRPKATRRSAALASALALGMTLAACGGDGGGGNENPGGDAGGDKESALDCAMFEKEPFTEFGDLDGKTVTVYTGIVSP